MENEIVPMIDKATPLSLEDREIMIFDLALSKMKRMIRRWVRKELYIPDEPKRVRNETTEEANKKMKLRRIFENSCTLNKIIVKMKDLQKLEHANELEELKYEVFDFQFYFLISCIILRVIFLSEKR